MLGEFMKYENYVEELYNKIHYSVVSKKKIFSLLLKS